MSLSNIELIRQKNKKVRIKVSLLDENYKEVDNITGRIVSSSYEVDSTSDIRRTCTLTLCVPEKSDLATNFQKTWNKRMVEMNCGIYDFEYNKMIWFSLGRMLMKSGNTTYDATTQEIKFSLVDLMANLTSDRGNQLGSSYLIKADTSVKTQLTAVITGYSDFKKTNICDFEDTVPYDVTTSIEQYPIDILHSVLDLFPYYEMYYDLNGVFVVRKIPQTTEEPVALDETVLDDLIISEETEMDYSKIKNATEIIGKVLSSEYTATGVSTVIDDNYYCYKGTIDSYEQYTLNDRISITPLSDSKYGQKIKINSLDAIKIYNSNGSMTEFTEIEDGDMKANINYIVRYNYTIDAEGNKTERFILLGQRYIHAISIEVNCDSKDLTDAIKEGYASEHGGSDLVVNWVINKSNPFACTISNGFIIGEMRQVLSDGDYSAISTTELAIERANYENYLACRMKDTVTIQTILIPWLDVNQKIKFTMPSTGELAQWLVQSISYDFEKWTMDIKCSRFDDAYPWY